MIIENNIDEFYFLTNPTRYELKTKTGDVSTLLICSRSEMNEHIRILKEEAAPEWLVECLKTENYVPYFRSIDGFYDQDSFDPNSAVYLAKVIEGREKYYCAYLNNDTAPLSSIFFTSGTNYH